MNDRLDTAILQYWMKDVIASPGTLQEKLQKAYNKYTLREQEVVSGEYGASVYRRLNVYVSGYVLRLLECLSADFPILQKFLGDEVFNYFAKASLVWSPSTSYTLYDLGNNFIKFLEATRPVIADTNEDVMLDLPIELAKLERARQEAIRAIGVEEDGAVFRELSFEDILLRPGEIVISTPECLRLLEQKFQMKSFFENVSQNDIYDMPEPQHTYIAVSRKNYRIVMEELQEWQFTFLQSCLQHIDLLQAIEMTAQKNNISDSQLMADLSMWLPVLCNKGFVVCTNQ